ncbi:TRAP transporter substrate-binding protein [Roseospira marina]|uniref:TRAP transporter substrate-binding protein n=1 Tax=Roseospira marina TaxID=140057 RepID=A0A5M6IET4_9PROT|nr:TRAP transporter substrate-binding protein [Roseospira marina]KAA5606781.1 TRAP transporter substrate-binding protein [Roseospira marina]MBB4313797.1 TRAP-type C4-dicarboxylate transport system substrate-binding protein [Roseospira marina]MBB5086959.1 TRAP-type C4-dicarboxylate transport system substrate-binding protein [Roseospira marina]
MPHPFPRRCGLIRTASLSAALALLLGLGLGATSARAETWDMPMAYAASNYHSENNAAFAAAVTERTGGALEIKTHPGGALVPGGEIFGAVRRGIAPIGERLMSALGNEDPIFEIDAVPFLATSFEEARALYDASKAATEQVLAEKGLKLLYAVPWPPQGLYSTRPIESIADMKGLKFRAYNPATSQLAELMGAIPTSIETAELSQAFATGVAESMISSGSTGYDRKIWEFVDYWYDVQAWLPKNMVIVNQAAWDGLDEATQAIVLEEATKAEDAGWAEAQRLADWYKEQLAANGMTVAPPSPTLKAEFRDLGATMAAEWKDRAGDLGAEVLEAYKAE